MQRVCDMPFGALPLAGGGARFRLWAPGARTVHLALGDDDSLREFPLDRDDQGWYAAEIAEARAGDLYRYRIDGDLLVPDPASRFQPRGIHGPSQLVDPAAHAWQDRDWRGRPWAETVLYELHVGSFTPAGDYDGVRRRLDHLAQIGITAVELMPLSDFPGQRNWGYDGVLPFAPSRAYGTPEQLKTLIEAAHARDLMVFVDVVYNHFGPDGNYLYVYARDGFFSSRHQTPWGDGLNFDGPDSRPVRDFFIANARYWLEEYHIDGLRLDAVHAIADDSDPDILEELATTVRTALPADRHVHLVLENDDNASRYLERDENGRPEHYVAQWNDDIHHAFHVLLSGEQGGYYEDYADDPLAHLGRCLTGGFAYQDDWSRHRQRQRGEPSDHLPPTAFVAFLQNHDQIGNRALGERLTRLSQVPALRAATAVLLLAPAIPMLFMGEEWGCDQPFPFFCDFGPDLADAVREGRRNEFASFPEFQDPEARAKIPDPNAPETMDLAVLAEVPGQSGWLSFHNELLSLRHKEIIPRLAGMGGESGSWTRLGDRAFHAWWQLGDGAHLHLLANLGPEPKEGEALPGRPLYMLGDIKPDHLPPWSVLWTLA